MCVCYDLADIFERLAETDDSIGTDDAFVRVMKSDMPAGECKLAFLRLFDDAIEEISMLPGLRDGEVSRMVQDVRSIQLDALSGLSHTHVQTIKGITNAALASRMLQYIGNTITTSQIVKPKEFNRSEFLSSTTDLIDFIASSKLSPLQKAVI